MIKKGTKLLIIFVVLTVSLAGSFSGAQSQSEDCRTVFIPPDTFRTICAGDGGSGAPPGGCTSGTTRLETIFVPIGPWGCEVIVRESRCLYGRGALDGG